MVAITTELTPELQNTTEWTSGGNVCDIPFRIPLIWISLIVGETTNTLGRSIYSALVVHCSASGVLSFVDFGFLSATPSSLPQPTWATCHQRCHATLQLQSEYPWQHNQVGNLDPCFPGLSSLHFSDPGRIQSSFNHTLAYRIILVVVDVSGPNHKWLSKRFYDALTPSPNNAPAEACRLSPLLICRAVSL